MALDPNSYNFHAEMLKAVKIFNDSNVALYSISAAGLQTGFWDAGKLVPNDSSGAPVYDFKFVLATGRVHTAMIQTNQSTMLELSGRTGGRAFLGGNDIVGAIQSAFDDPQASYRLGFYPGDLNYDGSYHDIRVKPINRPELRLRYRRGYFDSGASGNPKNLLRDALLSPVPARGVPLTAELKFKSGRYELKLTVGIAPVSLRPREGRLNGKLEVSLLQCDGDGEQLERLDETLGLKLTEETYATMLKSGLPYRHSFKPKAHATSLRVGVRDPDSGEIGSLTIPFEPPAS